jgi:hypothetical protein
MPAAKNTNSAASSPCIVGAVTEMQARAAHGPLAALDGLAHGLGRGGRRMLAGADGDSSSMG